LTVNSLLVEADATRGVDVAANGGGGLEEEAELEDAELEGAVFIPLEVFFSATFAKTSMTDVTKLSSSCFFSFLALIFFDQMSPPRS